MKIRNGLLALSALILGANSVVQAALPVILKETPASFYTSTNAFLAVRFTYQPSCDDRRVKPD